jgi:hypothetical protein
MKSIGSAPAVSKRNRVIVDFIGAHWHKTHMVSSAWSVDITLSSILLSVQCEIHIAGMFVGYIFLWVTHWKPSGGIEEAGEVKQFLSRYSTIEAGAALKTNASERGQSRCHCLILSLLIGFTGAVLCSAVSWLAAQMLCCVATSISWLAE